MKYYGGKYYLSRWVTSHFPEHRVYTETFGGAASVLLNKSRTSVEVYNDRDERIYTLLRELRDDLPGLLGRLGGVRCERSVFYDHLKIYNDAESYEALGPLERAATTYIVRRMSRGGACNAFSWSKREYGGKPEAVQAWESSLLELPAISARLSGVEMRNAAAWEVVEEYDAEDAVHYMDPPYVESSRTRLGVYAFEMTEDDHRTLAACARAAKGTVVISGYDSPLYRELFGDWRRVDKEVPNHGSHDKAKEKRVECLWVNR